LVTCSKFCIFDWTGSGHHPCLVLWGKTLWLLFEQLTVCSILLGFFCPVFGFV
jgi:hypothetical protein